MSKKDSGNKLCKYQAIKTSNYQYIRLSKHQNIMESKNKTIIIRLRVDEATATTIRKKADASFNGNVSACIRCATLQYESGSVKPSGSMEASVLLAAILRHLKKTGTNVNQIARQINERMKVSPYGLSASDIQPFVFFRQDLSQIYELIQHLKEKL